MSHNDVVDTTGPATDVNMTVVADYDALSKAAAQIVIDTINQHPGAAITLPTGETPRGMYEALVAAIAAGELDFSTINFFCLDEYLGKSIDDEASLTGWLDEVFFTPANLSGDYLHFVPSTSDDHEASARSYDEAIERLGGLKLAVVGLGLNGHVGFNEPGSAPDSPTRVIDLTSQSRSQNAAYYEGDQSIPSQAMTMGLGTILDAERIVLIVSGASKVDILKAVLEGPITADVPGSFLRTVGDRLVVIADEAAVAGLS